jgi:hypothetical protein
MPQVAQPFFNSLQLSSTLFNFRYDGLRVRHFIMPNILGCNYAGELGPQANKNLLKSRGLERKLECWPVRSLVPAARFANKSFPVSRQNF